MSVTYKDIDTLSQKSSVAGTEKLPVSDTQYITPSQIVAKEPAAAWFNPTNTTMYWFASSANKDTFKADNTRTDLVLFYEAMQFIAYRIIVVDSAGETSKSTTEDQTSLNITVGLTVQERSVVSSSWSDTSIAPIDVIVYVDSGNTGTYTQFTTQHLDSANTYTVDVRQPLVLGTNKVKIHCSLTSDASAVGDIEYTVALTAEAYMVFEDSTVGQICATNWGDGVGITRSQAAAVTSLGTKFKSNTTITKFNELQYFTGVSTTLDAFTGCTSLSEVTLPSTLTTFVGFRGCSSLTSIVVPNSVTTIGDSALRECSALRNLEIGTGVLSIANAAFYGVGTSLNKCTMIIRATSVPTISSNNTLQGNFAGIYVPYSSDHSILNAYKTASRWSGLASIIQELDENGNVPS